MLFQRVAMAAGLLLAAAVTMSAATVGGAMPVPLPLFPGNNWWNTDVSNAPVDPGTTSFIAFIGSGRALHPDYGGDVGDGTIYGFPFIVVDGAQPKKAVTFQYSDESDGVDHTTDTSFPFYPVPDEAITNSGWIEEGPPGNVDRRGVSDRHMLIVDQTNNTLYELYSIWYDGTGWVGGSGAFFDMKTNNRRTEGWTSADAAGLAILPGLVRYDEVYGPNEINHAFRFTVRTSNGFVYPASHIAGSTAGALPMGARVRLKAGKDISGFPADVQKIFRAFKKYGLIVADNGSDMYISGTYDNRWDMDVMNGAFGQLTASDFEVVQLGWQPATNFLFAVPANIGAGDAAAVTLTAYDPSYNLATGYRGTVHFNSSDGSATLPVDYAFTAADSGTHTFTITMRTAGGQTVTVTDTASATITSTRPVLVGPPAPTGFSATTASTAQVDLSWTASPGATQYEIARATSPNAFTTLTATAATNYSDTAVVAGTTYIYKVRAIDGLSRPSGYTAPDAATTVVFTDDALVSGTTPIKAVHISELRNAINIMRAAAGSGPLVFTDPSLVNAPIRAVHIQELRNALNNARVALGLQTVGFTDPGLAGGTVIKAAHVQELRTGVK